MTKHCVSSQVSYTHRLLILPKAQSTAKNNHASLSAEKPEGIKTGIHPFVSLNVTQLRILIHHPSRGEIHPLGCFFSSCQWLHVPAPALLSPMSYFNLCIPTNSEAALFDLQLLALTIMGHQQAIQGLPCFTLGWLPKNPLPRCFLCVCTQGGFPLGKSS